MTWYYFCGVTAALILIYFCLKDASKWQVRADDDELVLWAAVVAFMAFLTIALWPLWLVFLFIFHFVDKRKQNNT